MQKIIIESVIIGIITAFIGNIFFKIFTKNNIRKKRKPKGMEIAFFFTGVALSLFGELTGFNKVYCDRKCKTELNNIAKI
jgi:H+/Cl- antiporter ClcA